MNTSLIFCYFCIKTKVISPQPQRGVFVDKAKSGVKKKKLIDALNDALDKDKISNL